MRSIPIRWPEPGGTRLCQHRRDFGDGAAALLLLLADIDLQEAIGALAALVHRLGQTRDQRGAVDSVDHIEERDRVLGLVGLQLADQMEFDAGLFLQQVGQALGRQPRPTVGGGGGEGGILPHLIPFGLATDLAGDGLQGVVEPVEHEVLGGIQKAFGPAAAEGIGEDVPQRRPEIAVPVYRLQQADGCSCHG